MYAPSAHNQQPREFLVIQNKDHLLRLSQHLKFGKMLAQANAAIITCFNKTIITDPAFIQQDMSACTQNILLAAHEKGVGAVRIGVYPLNNPGHFLNTYLQLPDHIDIFNIIAL
ncbi:MAG: nitroreductase family protein [Candidatus Peribacteria bacterium]|jgi:nitroreductase|nr:nitroreductase family protein [Candidatus Peribacteria bacterium]